MDKSLRFNLIASSFFRVIDIIEFERENADLIKDLETWNMTPENAHKMQGFWNSLDKNSVCAALVTAKYAPEGSDLKLDMITRLSRLIDEHFSSDKVSLAERDSIVDAVSTYLPLHKPAFENLRHTINSWEMTVSAIEYAREHSHRPEL